MKPESPVDTLKISTGSVLEHLDGICSSPAFISSKRCQQFLRYVVQESIRGRSEQIKERNIAHEVFGKGSNFEPGEYSLVRVKAGEVRKRLSDYYEATPPNGIRIELPVGSYVPRIHTHQDNEAVDTPAAGRGKPISRRTFAWMAGGTLTVLGAGSLVPLFLPKPIPLDRLWRPVFATKAPLLIFIPLLRGDNGEVTESVGIGPSATLGRAAVFLTEHHYPYHLRFGSEMSFSQLREQPSLLLGGFDMEWTGRMTRNLRFAPLTLSNQNDRAFMDRQTKQVWRMVRRQTDQSIDTDYGILCRLFDSASGQIVFLAVGTWTYGTEGAASFLFDPDLFAGLVKQAPSNWETRNIQALIRVSVIGTTPSNPQLVATYFW